jgi:acetylornithine deacetylase/succinyl-diaminopimelate desuccinylase-like protein
MAALRRAIAQAWDADPDDVLYLREGGSGPEADLVEQLGAPLLFLGAGLPTDRIHSPNERVLLPMLHRGAEAAGHLWRELAGIPGRS